MAAREQKDGWQSRSLPVCDAGAQLPTRAWNISTGDGYVTEDALAPEDAPFEHQAPADPDLALLKMTAIDTNANRRAKLKARNRVHIRRWLDGIELDPDALSDLAYRAVGWATWRTGSAASPPGIYDGAPRS